MIPKPNAKNAGGTPIELRADDVPLVLVGIAPLPLPLPLPDADDLVPVALAVPEVLVDAAKKRSVDWKVLQFDEEGTRGV